MMTIVLKTGCTLLVIGGLTTTSVAGLSEGGPMVGFHEEAIMTASDSSVAGYLGWDVDFAESVLIAGAPRQGGGHAVVGYLNQWGALVSTDELAASDAIENDLFGWSVAIGGLGESGGVAFVGVPGWAREEAPLNSGAVYVFTPDSSGVPTEAGIITPTSGPLFRAYGNRLDFDGTRLAVGAFLESMEEDDAGQPIAGHGAVYVYDIGSDGLPTDEQRVVCEIPLPGQSLGFDVSLDGDQMAVSAPKDPTVIFNSGAVYHFERQSNNEWLQTQLIAPADLASADSYGTAVALVGDTLIVGCPDRDIIQEGDEEPTARLGVVYVYARVDGVFEEVQQIMCPLPQAQSAWGLSLSFDGQHLVIGSPLWDNQNLLDDGFDTGLVAVYELGMDGTFTLGRVIAASDGEEDDGFAYSVAISEERVLIGSIEGSALDGDGTPNGGMAYIYRATCSGDIDGNGAIQPDDFIEVLAQWGETGVLPEDVVQDYEVGIYDLLTMLEYYGACN